MRDERRTGRQRVKLSFDKESQPWRRPRSDPPELSGAGQELPPWLQERLFDQRIVMVTGVLNPHTAAQVAASLLALDMLGAEPVELHLAVPDGELAATFALMDVLESMQAPVNATVTALTGGAGVGLLAVSGRRRAYPRSRIRLSEPRAVLTSGTADEVATVAGQYLRELEELVLRISARTGQPRSRVEDDLSAGRVFTGPEAAGYGLVDEVVGGAR
jgi:ATP-dependent Clp protease, protease subunit